MSLIPEKYRRPSCRIGYSISGVMTETQKERSEGGGTYRATEPFIGCLHTIAAAVRKWGPETQFVFAHVCNPAAVPDTEALLSAWEFFPRTGVRKENVHVHQGGIERTVALATEHALTHMVHYRVEVLAAMPPAVQLIAFAPKDDEMRQFRSGLGSRQLTIVRNWNDLAAHLGL